MGILLTVAGFLLVVVFGRKSLGHGLGATFAVGCVYGIARARFPDGYSHFMFDFAVLALYATQFLWVASVENGRGRSIKVWLWALGLWPVLVIPLSLLLGRPTQPLLIQVVGLRASFLFLPVLLLGARLTSSDFSTLQKWAVLLTGVAFVFALLELQLGVEQFYPINEVTALIYKSNDVGPSRQFRIPAIFTSAHAYAGTMAALLPILLAKAESRRWQVLSKAALGCALLGIFMSGARSPVVQVGLMVGLLLLTTRLPVRWMVSLIVVGLCVTYVVLDNPRFQRFESLQDTELIQERIGWSLNKGLWEVITELPMGAGLGSAMGTSIPFFLAGDALPQMGLENEYGRIALEQGIVGLLLWLVFLAYCLRRPQAACGFDRFPLRLMWIFSVVAWGTAFIGTGILTSIPSVLLLMVQMGLVAEAGWTPRSEPLTLGWAAAHPKARLI